MPRQKRSVVPGEPHHITQRGNSRQIVFHDEEDRIRYLSILGDEFDRNEIKCLAIALMPNHIHQVLIPPSAENLAMALGETHCTYARAFNRKYGKSGHLWQNRFYSCAMDPAHTYQAIRYVELNPVRAGLAVRPGDYTWSSAKIHLGLAVSLPGIRLSTVKDVLDPGSWNSFLEEPEVECERQLIRSLTSRGRRWGSL